MISCEICGKEFTVKTSYYRHRRRLHGITSVNKAPSQLRKNIIKLNYSILVRGFIEWYIFLKCSPSINVRPTFTYKYESISLWVQLVLWCWRERFFLPLATTPVNTAPFAPLTLPDPTIAQLIEQQTKANERANNIEDTALPAQPRKNIIKLNCNILKTFKSIQMVQLSRRHLLLLFKENLPRDLHPRMFRMNKKLNMYDSRFYQMLPFVLECSP